MEFCCRLCLKETPDTESIFNVREELPISVIIMIMCPIKIQNNDKLSKSICFECLEVVTAAYLLRENSINNDRYQRSCLKSDTFEDRGVRIKEEDLEEDNFVSYFSDPISVEVLPVSTKAEVLASKKSLWNSQFKVNCYKKNAKSIAWSYFGLLTDMNSVIVDDQKEFYYCRVCVEKQNVMTKYRRSVSTSGMLTHLMRDHSINGNEEIKQLGAEQNTCDFCHDCFDNNIALQLHIKDFHLNLPPISTQIERIDNTDNYKVEGNTNPNRKSMVWDYFGLLMTEKGEIIKSEINYNYCRICVEERKNLTTKYKKTVATSNMLHHLKIEHGIESACDEIKRKKSDEISKSAIVNSCFKSTKTSDNELQFKVKLYRKHSKSFAWKYFGLLLDANDVILLDHVDYHFCRICVEERNVLTVKYKKTAATSVMLQHLKTEHSVEPMNCESPEKNATLVAENSSNRIRILKEPFKKPNQHLSCDICGKTCDRKHKIRMHMRLKHLNELLPAIFTCDICGNSFTKNYILTKHMKIHSGIKFPCDRCPAQLCNLNSLRRHQNLHLNVKPFICEICGAAYSEAKVLKRHMGKHDGTYEKRFSCEVCGLKKYDLGGLKAHMRIHTGEKPHQCEHCERRYALKADLTKHLRSHVGQNTYKCEFCSDAFRLQVELRDHYQVHYQIKSDIGNATTSFE